jgi:hypothetical protein
MSLVSLAASTVTRNALPIVCHPSMSWSEEKRASLLGVVVVFISIYFVISQFTS